jgi:hypothetical protein
MSERFTPGPWMTEGNDIGGWQIWHDSLCICQRSDWPHYAERSAANARLIAAAPDLYEALDDAVVLLPDCPERDAARAALALARGETAP